MAGKIKPTPKPITNNEDIDAISGNIFYTHLVYSKPFQLMLICLEKCFMVLEKTALWLDKTKCTFCPTTLVRPLPWLLFLPLCFAIRCTLSTLSLVTHFGFKEPTIASTRTHFKNARKWLQSHMYASLRLDIASSDEESDQESDQESDAENLDSTDLYKKLLLNQTIESDEGCDEDYVPHESESTETDDDDDEIEE